MIAKYTRYNEETETEPAASSHRSWGAVSQIRDMSGGWSPPEKPHEALSPHTIGASR